MECQYKEVFINNSKYWCKAPCLLSVEIVETRESEREVRRGRVSIRDRPANLTFTVTLESLREEDAGRYRCGIETSWFEGILRDPTFQIEVFVVPGEHRPPSLQHQAGHPDPQEGSGTERLGQDDQEEGGRTAGCGWCLGPMFIGTQARLCLLLGPA